MHELSVVISMIETVERTVKENDLKKVEKVVLQIGELSSYIPQMVKECYGPAVEGSVLEGTELEIEVLEAMGKCTACGEEYPLKKCEGICPKCGSTDFHIISGREFYIKEILAC